MKDDHADKLIDTVREHGNQLSTNLGFLKHFLARLQREQHEFLAEQRQASDRAQKSANRAAIFSAIAAGAAALAAIVQAWDAIKSP